MLKRIMKRLLKQMGNSEINKERLRRELLTFDRVNAGCGDMFVENWLNIGLFSYQRIPYGTCKKVDNAQVMNFDLTDDVPLQTNTIQYLYSSHFIEHLTFDQALVFLRRCYHILLEGAILRFTTPDLELWLDNYCENDLAFFERFYHIEPSHPTLATKGQILIGQIQGWRHRWLYDYSSLKDILIRAGFRDITRKEAFVSSIPDIAKLEPNSEVRLMETLYVEAQK